MANIDKRPLKAYVRFDGTGRIVPSSLILRRKMPKVGKWAEIPAYECCNDIIPPVPLALILRFASEFPVVDPNDVSLWNTKLGSTFTSVSISGLEARLTGGSSFNMLQYALVSSGILSIDDQINSVQQLSTYSLAGNPGLNTIKLPALTSIINNYTFMSSGTDLGDVIIYIPLCASIGATVGDDGVFNSAFGGKNVTLTVPSSRMTCNGGNPDGDIQTLQATNTVTIITV